VIVTGSTGNILQVNEEATFLLGYTRDKIIGESIDIIFLHNVSTEDSIQRESVRELLVNKNIHQLPKTLRALKADRTSIDTLLSVGQYNFHNYVLTIRTEDDIVQKTKQTFQNMLEQIVENAIDKVATTAKAKIQEDLQQLLFHSTQNNTIDSQSTLVGDANVTTTTVANDNHIVKTKVLLLLYQLKESNLIWWSIISVVVFGFCSLLQQTLFQKTRHLYFLSYIIITAGLFAIFFVVHNVRVHLLDKVAEESPPTTESL